MSYNFFAIVDAQDDDDALYPVLSAPQSNCPVEIGAADGSVTRIQAGNVKVLESTSSGLSQPYKLPADLKWDVLVTDSRLIVFCEKYDKGGGWSGWGVGGLAVAVAANAVSKARAAHRRKGKVLVAQVRYPWIERLLATPKQGWATKPTVRIRVDAEPSSGSARMIMLEIELAKNADALAVGHELAVRAARYRIANDPEMASGERAGFDLIANSPRRQVDAPDDPKQRPWASYLMPTSYRVNHKTAFPQRIANEIT